MRSPLFLPATRPELVGKLVRINPTRAAEGLEVLYAPSRVAVFTPPIVRRARERLGRAEGR